MSLTVQKQVGNHDSVQVGYVGSMGRHLDSLGYYNSSSVILPTSVNPQNYVPFPNFARNSTYESTNANQQLQLHACNIRAPDERWTLRPS